MTGPGAEPWEVHTVTGDARADLEGATATELSQVSGDGSCCTTTDHPTEPAAACC